MQTAHRPSPRTEAGFTLVELLIVMSVILILITLALPGYEHLHIRADETSAISSVRFLNQMEGEYNSAYAAKGYACTLPSLGGKQGSGPPTPDAAQLIPEDLASGSKAGYTFTLACGNKTTSNNQDQYNSYSIIAQPTSLGKSGNRSFCSDESGQIRFDPKGTTNCTDLLQ